MIFEGRERIKIVKGRAQKENHRILKSERVTRMIFLFEWGCSWTYTTLCDLQEKGNRWENMQAHAGKQKK